MISSLRLLLLGLTSLLFSCASKTEDSTKKSDPPKKDPIAVGIIEFVNPDQKFVLIKMHSRLPMPIGQTLTALDATGTLTQLTISPERKGTHVTADIKSGNPRPGNLVIFQPDPTTTPPIAAPQVNSSLPTTTGIGPVEWRDGQPPPIINPGASPLPPHLSTTPAVPPPIIPLEPLPEEPPASTVP